MKKMMAVYDTDPVYAERLSDYVNRKRKGNLFCTGFYLKRKTDGFRERK